MTTPYSIDLRERLVLAVLSGESCHVVAARFSVAVSSVVKWSQRHRATDSVAPGKTGGHRRRLLDPDREFIVQRINQTRHLTPHRLNDELAACGVVVTHSTVWEFLRREGLRFKKHWSLLSGRGWDRPQAMALEGLAESPGSPAPGVHR